MKIGIITMHKVKNYGSALQSFALQYAIKEMGYNSEIIDYNLEKRKRPANIVESTRKKIIGIIKNIATGFSHSRSLNKFFDFYKNYLIITKQSYNKSNINTAHFDYDIYMTGSDQVWNPKHIGTDVNYFLSFAPQDKRKISYASSFAATNIDEPYKSLYAKCLSEYDYISVRENTGKELVSEMTGKEAVIDIDPVLLINAKVWTILTKKSCLKKRKKYILVYALYYMFDPYPELKKIIEHVQKSFSLEVVYLNARTFESFMPNSTIYKAGGPLEFLYLIKNAEFVITTSFHGTVFSAIFDKPVIGIVKGDNSDDRISSFLTNLNSKDSIVPYNSDISRWDQSRLLSLKCDQNKLKQLSDRSKANLQNSINTSMQ